MLTSGLISRLASLPWRGFAAILGGFLLQFTMGAFYSFGNMSTYMTSYMRQNGSPNVTYTDFVIVQSAWGMTQGFVMPLSGFLITAIGEKASMIAGSIIFSAGCALTHITINKELWMVAATYGFVSAFGQNIALIPTLTTGMKWFPRNKGIAMGCVVGGFGGGALVFNFIQTAILNPNNVSPAESGPHKGYFTDPDLLSRVPGLLLTLGGIYLGLGLFACLIITQPPSDWLEKSSKEEEVAANQEYVTPCEALQRKELFLLWITRLSVVLMSNGISAFYKAFGQTFIRDDRFLSLVGSINSVFNCTGRVFYGFIMDKTAYKVSMTIEATLLITLMSTFYFTSLIGVDPSPLCEGADLVSPLLTNVTTTDLKDCLSQAPETATVTKAVYAIWVWAIYFTFPGTYSTQPAVTVQTFGHKYGGFIYAFLFSGDIINNLITALMSRAIKDRFGWGGLFPIMSAFGLLALTATYFYPYKPRPGPRPLQGQCEHPWLAKIGLVELREFDYKEEEEEEEEKKAVTKASGHHQGYQGISMKEMELNKR